MGEVSYNTAVDKAAAEAEGKVNPSIPAALRPEAKLAEDAAVAEVDAAAAQAPAAEAAAAAAEPGIDALARDAAKVGQGGTVPLSDFVTAFPSAVKEVKAGYKTTEFWLSGAVIVLAQVGALAIPGKYGGVVSEAAAALSAGLYAISRGIAKK